MQACIVFCVRSAGAALFLCCVLPLLPGVPSSTRNSSLVLFALLFALLIVHSGDALALKIVLQRCSPFSLLAPLSSHSLYVYSRLHFAGWRLISNVACPSVLLQLLLITYGCISQRWRLSLMLLALLCSGIRVGISRTYFAT